ncbi:acetyl-CoA synthetase-like protein [Stipitochalara longipes BDJ]|nr:acetyl-CoA synthetase-like protein [Stipitochalara longipes BDJ]
MIYSASKSYDIPNLDLLSFLFDSPLCGAKEDTVLHVEASDPSNTVTKSQARDLTRNVAYNLRNTFGIGANGSGKDVVVCISSGQILLPIVLFGVIAAGGVFSAASSAFTPSELSRQVKQGSSNLIFCSEDAKDVAVKSAKECGVSLNRILVISSGKGKWGFRSVEGDQNCLGGKGALEWERITDRKKLANSLACLLYSSGTTGIPKGVELSHTNIVAQSYIPTRMYKEGRAARNEPPFEYRTLAHLPAAHIAGVMCYLVNPFSFGGTVYWMPRFDFLQFLEYNKKFRITFFFTVPPIWLLIAKMPNVTDQFDNLEMAISGAAPLGKDLQHAASSKLGKGKTFISQTWGLSETTGSSTVMPWGERDETGSVSPLMPNMSLRLVDDNGKDVEEGKPGEIWMKGPVVTNGYYRNPQATKDSFVDGWFCTGDIAIWKNGLPYIVDRKKKELIKYKGAQVAPAELEGLLLTHPKILDAAVIGVEIPGTEAPRAYIVKGGDITEQEVKEFVKQNASSHKQLRGGVVFMDVIPKSPSGKILRKDLRELAKKEARAKL